MQSQYLYKNLGEIDLKIMQSQYLYKNVGEIDLKDNAITIPV